MAFSPLQAALSMLCALTFRASGMHVSAPLALESQSNADTSAFISDNGLVCKDGPSRSVESALALEKAGVKGELYKLTFAHRRQTCSALGFETPGGEDACHPGVAAFFRDGGGPERHRLAEEKAVRRYAALFGLTEDIVSLMAACTCHPHSIDMAHNRSNCNQLDAYQGTWVHRDPVTSKAILCHEGPFIYSTLALAVVKTYAQLPMHEFDSVAPVGCAELGFPHQQWAVHHCFPAMHLSTETSDMATDPGAASSSYIERMLFGGGFDMWAKAKNKDLDMATLGSTAGCHCMSTSSVYQSMAETCEANKAAKKYSPVREWWHGQVP
mmetsp:Transcript_107298/g.313749  ORF Transcript_107298/g.313749 Transcript_107298/m.313749 type:complete len:326 (+) Transcript_107298:104-1081(+)